MEKIRSGQPYLYRKDYYNSTMTDVHMKDVVQGNDLMYALTSTCQRFPYMTSKLVEKDV